MSRMCKAGDIDLTKNVPRACAANQMPELRAASRRSMDQHASFAAYGRVLSMARLFPYAHIVFNSLGPIVDRHSLFRLGEVGPSGSQMNACDVFLNTGIFRGKVVIG